MHVLLVDDHPVSRMGFASMLAQMDQSAIIYEADNAEQAIKICTSLPPTVALVDLSLGGELCLDLIKTIRTTCPKTAILVVSMHDERLYAERSLRAGARGYIMKHNAAKTIVQAVHTILKGQIWLSEDMRSMVLERLTDGSDLAHRHELESLSDRELEVFRLIGQGFKKSDIAKKLRISPNTVEKHRTNIKQKLNFESGAELHRYAVLRCQEEMV